MERAVLEDVTLSDNIQLKRGTGTMIMPRMRDPTLYEKPDEYDGYRFLRLRQEDGGEKVSACSWPLVSETTLPSLLGATFVLCQTDD